MSGREPEQGEPGGAGGSGSRGPDSFERALAEFFVQPGDPDRLEASRPEGGAGQADAVEAVGQYLSFRLAGELFAVSIFNIKEIIKPTVSTELPRTDPVILGVLSLRGTVLPIVDLRRLLGLDELPQTRRSRILIVDNGGELVGLLVDEVRSVIRLREQDIEPPPAVFDRAEADHLIGVGRFDGEMYTLVNLQDMVQLERFILAGQGGRPR